MTQPLQKKATEEELNPQVKKTPAEINELLDEALRETFPASDPVSRLSTKATPRENGALNSTASPH